MKVKIELERNNGDVIFSHDINLTNVLLSINSKEIFDKDNKKYGGALMKLWEELEKTDTDNFKLTFTKLDGKVTLTSEEIETPKVELTALIDDPYKLGDKDEFIKAAKRFKFRGLRVQRIEGSYTEERWDFKITLSNGKVYEVVTYGPSGPGGYSPYQKNPPYAYIDYDKERVYLNADLLWDIMANYSYNLPFELIKQVCLIPRHEMSKEFKELIK